MNARLLNLRAKLNLTQAQMAEKLGVSKISYHLWENGKGNPNKVNLVKIEMLEKAKKK